MSIVVLPVYFLFFLGVLVTSIFIVYHITKYSLSEENARWGKLVFFVGLGVLVLINLILFASIDWRGIDFQIQPIPDVEPSVW